MKQHKLDLFRLKVQQSMRRYKLSINADEEQRFAAAHQYYKHQTRTLNKLIERTLNRNEPVTCIFLLHQIDVLVNHFFGLRKDGYLYNE
jgi:hypothetical protein